MHVLNSILAVNELLSPLSTFSACKHFHSWGFFGMWKIILEIPSWEKFCETLLRSNVNGDTCVVVGVAIQLVVSDP